MCTQLCMWIDRQQTFPLTNTRATQGSWPVFPEILFIRNKSHLNFFPPCTQGKITLPSIPHFCGLVFNYRVEWSPGYLCFFKPQPENFCRNWHARVCVLRVVAGSWSAVLTKIIASWEATATFTQQFLKIYLNKRNGMLYRSQGRSQIIGHSPAARFC